ncbi:MAG TPA: hypothetical protein VH478_15500 [Trebonia sp.]|jgi:hypothetical protein|nr:hypothetical protein [Trebonia sp.]
MGFVLDVADYGARSAPLRSEVQRRLPVLAGAMLAGCGIALGDIEHEWTGDGVNVVMPADTDPTIALPVLLRTLARLLGEDNARSADRLRLRMSVGIGVVENSAAGFGGPMIIEMSRLVDCGPLRDSLTAYPGAHLAVAISDQVHSAIIRPGYPGIPASQFSRVEVAEKEFRAPAWIWISTRQWATPAYGPLHPGDPRDVGDSPTHRYRLLARLGAGRDSTVYLALSPPGAAVALKVLRPEAAADADARHRLVTAVKAARGMHDPRVAAIVDADPRATTPWIATALVPGPSLDAVVTNTGPLPPRPALWLVTGVAHALAASHEAGIAHGALRPSNVLLSPDGPVVTDVGAGWPDGADRPATPAGDVLALGFLAFYAATGRTPYGAWPAGGEPDDRGLEGTAGREGDRGPGAAPAPDAAAGLADLADLDGCPPGLLPVVQACLRPSGQRPPVAALLAQLTAAAGPMPRAWLPPAVATRLAEYQALPGRGRGRAPRQLRASGLLPWLARRRERLRRGERGR